MGMDYIIDVLWCVCVESLGYGYGLCHWCVVVCLCEISWLWVWSRSLCVFVSVWNFLAMGLFYIVGVLWCVCEESLGYGYGLCHWCCGVSVWNLFAIGMD